jgi:hypothetical protein
MLARRLVAVVAATAPVLALLVAAPVTARAEGATRVIFRAARTAFIPTPAGTGAVSGTPVSRVDTHEGAGPPEPASSPAPPVPPGPAVDDTGAGGRDSRDGRAVLLSSFDGIGHRQQRLANNGNQLNQEPPDQGLCVGSGLVMESVNDAVNVYDANGHSLKGVTDLNTFYGYPPAVVRATPAFGPFVGDPSCLFDQATQRWFQLALTFERVPQDGRLTGVNHLDLAVSDTSSPLGTWSIFRLDTTDDGTNGTPDHHCSPAPGARPAHANACLGDFPRLGADRNGIFLTTDEFGLFSSRFVSANIYALPKRALVSGAAAVRVTQFDTVGAVRFGARSEPGFTVWPAIATDGRASDRAGGTEFFGSSDAAPEVTNAGTSNRLVTWALTNTRSLDGTPDLHLVNRVSLVPAYALPPHSEQKAGDVPLARCLNDTTMTTLLGPGCWRFLRGTEPAHNEVESLLDSSDSRVMQVELADGLLWTALDTAVTVRGAPQAGIEWFAVRPETAGRSIDADVVAAGFVALAGNNLTYPAIGMTSSGRGVMAFTVVGRDHFPSAGYAAIDRRGVGPVQIAAEGLGPQDGYSGYHALSPPDNPRWGDYGGAVPSGGEVWIGSEYIGQTCNLATYADPADFGSCGGTRTTFANWYTRISHLRV